MDNDAGLIQRYRELTIDLDLSALTPKRRKAVAEALRIGHQICGEYETISSAQNSFKGFGELYRGISEQMAKNDKRFEHMTETLLRQKHENVEMMRRANSE